MVESAVADNSSKQKAPDKSVASDRQVASRDSVSAVDHLHVCPTNNEMQAHAATSKCQDKTGGGTVDANGGLSVGDTASLYSNQKQSSNVDANTEKAASATATVAPGEKNIKPGLDLKTDPKVGSEAAHTPDVPNGPPEKRSDKISYTDTPGYGAKEVQDARQKLEGAENAGGMRSDLKDAMQKHMDDLEHRKPPATAEQIVGVYQQTTRLLEDKEGKSNLTPVERQRLATDVMSNAAQQHEIDQGMHNTCNVTTIEEALNRQNPDKAAKFVADIALNGQFKSGDRNIYIDPSSIKPDAEANLSGTSSANGDRNYASQVFDMGAVNAYWQHHDPPAVYTQVPGKGQADTGERLKYLNGQEMTGPDGQFVRSPNMGTKAIAEVGQQLGLDSKVISTKEFQQSDSNGGPGETRAQDFNHFKSALLGSLADKDGKSIDGKTAIVFLNGHDSTLFGGTSDKGGASSGHVITVSDYKAGPPEQVYMRNQWGSENNKWVSIQDLYNASIPPKSADHITDSSHAVNNGEHNRTNTNDSSGHGGHGSEGGTRGGASGGGGGGIFDRGGSIMTDKQFKEWEEKIKKEEPPAASSEKAHQNKIDYDKLYQLMPQLEEARSKKDVNAVSALQSRIDNLLNSGN